MTDDFLKVTLTHRQEPDELRLVWPALTPPREDIFADHAFRGDCRELLLALGRLNENGSLDVIGSGVMVAPGLLLTATHVLADGEMFALAWLSGNLCRAWRLLEGATFRRCVEEIALLGIARFATADVSLVACELMSEPHVGIEVSLATLDCHQPCVGERLWCIGYRAVNQNDHGPGLAVLISSGLVTEFHQDGRGNQLPSAVVEVDMKTVGGMSGGPVFNDAGNLVGVVSKSEDGGRSLITLGWPSMLMNISPNWPSAIWQRHPMNMLCSGMTPLMAARHQGYVRTRGTATYAPNGKVMLVN